MVRTTAFFADGSKGPRRPFAFWLHSLLGLKLSFVMLFVSFTGTIATVSDEIEWLFLPELRASEATEFSWHAQHSAARAAYPDYRLDYMTAGEEPYLVTRIQATSAAGKRRVIYVDPGTNQVMGESGFVTFRSAMRALHYYLFVPGDAVFYAVAALGFVLVASAITGLIIYKKFWRGLFRMPRWRKGARTVWGDLHRLAGLWSLPFILIIGLTSIWYLVERAMYRADLDWEVRVERRIAESASIGGERLSLDVLAKQAIAMLTDYQVTAIALPRRPDEGIVFNGKTGAWWVRDRANQVAMNPYNGEILDRRQTVEAGALEIWGHMADPLHFGDFGGLWSKLVWVLFGIALCGMSLSGAVIYVRRLSRRLHCVDAKVRTLAFLGWLRWPSLAAVTLVPAVAFFIDWLPGLQ